MTMPSFCYVTSLRVLGPITVLDRYLSIEECSRYLPSTSLAAVPRCVAAGEIQFARGEADLGSLGVDPELHLAHSDKPNGGESGAKLTSSNIQENLTGEFTDVGGEYSGLTS